MERSSELHKAPGAENFIVVYPDGVRRTWNAGECCGPAEKMNVDDLGFFDAMMADLSSVTSISPQAYVTGYSNGALMVYQLVCKRPGRIAAAAPFAAYPPPDAMLNCPPGQVPLMHIHGDADRGAPVEGGKTRYLGFLPPVADTVNTIARRNGCDVSGTSRLSVPELDTSCVQHTGCDGGADAMLCIVPGLGHSWPGMSGRPGGRFGPARPELEGSEAVIEFFLRH
jgi:polyhydroxybutyrate depolymerase